MHDDVTPAVLRALTGLLGEQGSDGLAVLRSGCLLLPRRHRKVQAAETTSYRRRRIAAEGWMAGRVGKREGDRVLTYADS